MKWFRVELDKSGAIISCVEVEASSKDTKHVRFIEGSDAAEACSVAKAWHEHASARQRAYCQKLRDRQKDAGLCGIIGCKSIPKSGKRMCEKHLANAAAHMRRKAAGGVSLLRKLTPEQAYSEYKERVAAHNKKNGGRRSFTYGGLLRKFDAMGPVAFRAWLVSKIPVAQPEEAKAAE